MRRFIALLSVTMLLSGVIYGVSDKTKGNFEEFQNKGKQALEAGAQAIKSGAGDAKDEAGRLAKKTKQTGKQLWEAGKEKTQEAEKSAQDTFEKAKSKAKKVATEAGDKAKEVKEDIGEFIDNNGKRVKRKTEDAVRQLQKGSQTDYGQGAKSSTESLVPNTVKQEVASVAADTMRGVVTGEMTPKEALEAAQNQMTEMAASVTQQNAWRGLFEIALFKCATQAEAVTYLAEVIHMSPEEQVSQLVAELGKIRDEATDAGPLDKAYHWFQEKVLSHKINSLADQHRER